MAWPRPSLSALIRRTAEDLKSRLEGDPFLRRSFEAALTRVISALAHGLYGHQEHIARQAVPGPDADDETVLRWAALFLDPPQILATRAKGPATFTGTNSSTLPEGTEVSIGDVLYTVDSDGAVTGGEVTVDLTAVDAGADANAEQGARVRLTSPVAGIDSSGEVAEGGITGGTNDESISSIRARLEARLANPPRGGGPGDYIAWLLAAREIGVPVAKAWEYPRRGGLGRVGIAFTVEGDDPVNLPTEQQRDDVHEYVLDRAPETLRELVSLELQPVPFELEVNVSPFNTASEEAVHARVKDLLSARAEPEVDVLRSTIVAAIVSAGLDDFDVISPVADVNPGTSAIFVYDEESITIGPMA